MPGIVAYSVSFLFWTIFAFMVFPCLFLCLAYRWLLTKLILRYNSKIHRPLQLGSSYLFVAHPDRTNIAFCIGIESTVTLDEVQAKFESRVISQKDSNNNLTRAELQQYAVAVCGYYFWQWEDTFDLQHHVRFMSDDVEWNKKVKTAKEILEILDRSMDDPWKDRQSPWELLVVPNFHDTAVYGQEGMGGYVGTLLVLKFDHVLGDGATMSSLTQDLFNPIDNGAQLQPHQFQKYSMNKSSQTIRQYFLSPYKLILCNHNLRYATNLTPDLQRSPIHGPVPTNSSNIGITPVIPFTYFNQIRTSHSVTFTASALGLIVKAYQRFVTEAGHGIPEHMVYTSTRGIARPDGEKMGNFLYNSTLPPVGFRLTTDDVQLFQRVNRHLNSGIDSMIPWLQYEGLKLFDALPTVVQKACANSCSKFKKRGTLFTNVPCSSTNGTDLFLNKGFGRVRTIFARFSQLAVAFGFVCLSIGTKDGVRFVFQLDEGLVVSKGKLSADVLVQYFLEELEKWNQK